jgi:hypothetical protein
MHTRLSVALASNILSVLQLVDWHIPNLNSSKLITFPSDHQITFLNYKILINQ